MAQPVYMGRREKLTYGIATIVLGLIVINFVTLLGQLLIGIGILMIANGIIRGKERIA